MSNTNTCDVTGAKVQIDLDNNTIIIEHSALPDGYISLQVDGGQDVNLVANLLLIGIGESPQ